MQQGTILDFLQLVDGNSALRKELVELARKFEFEFAPVELSDDQLSAVAGGSGWKDVAEMYHDQARQMQQVMHSIILKQQEAFEKAQEMMGDRHSGSCAISTLTK